jgi:pyruvate,water dikinase
MKKPYILWFDEIDIGDIGLVGGKNASLGEMYRHLKKKKIKVPAGFAITSYAYRYVLEKGGVLARLKAALKGIDPSDTKALEHAGETARKLILGCELPADLEAAIVQAYRKLKHADVAVRSSATAEDLPTASFAGQQETFLNISGEQELLQACKRCFASLFTNRAIAYRCQNQIDHFYARYRDGISQRGVYHRKLWPGRKRRPRNG